MADLCVVSNSAGVFCRQSALPGAPFPICMKHAAAVRTFLEIAQRDPNEVAELQAFLAELPAPPPPAPTVVYYLRVGDLIKIGYTDQLAQRLTAYPPSSILLGLEIGGRDREMERHKQFRSSLRFGREWFEESSDLKAHIADLPRLETTRL